MKRSTTEDAAFDHLIAGNQIINTHGDATEAAAEYQKAADAFGEAREEASRVHDGAAYDRCDDGGAGKGQRPASEDERLVTLAAIICSTTRPEGIR